MISDNYFIVIISSISDSISSDNGITLLFFLLVGLLILVVYMLISLGDSNEH